MLYRNNMRTYETQQLELVNYEILDSVVKIIKKRKRLFLNVKLFIDNIGEKHFLHLLLP